MLRAQQMRVIPRYEEQSLIASSPAVFPMRKKEAPKSMTTELDKRLNECARNLNDGKLLARLTAGDTVTQELKYHRSCLTEPFFKQLKRKSKAGHQRTKYILSKLLAYIVETKLSTDGRSCSNLLILLVCISKDLNNSG